jgi:hypothetical protein
MFKRTRPIAERFWEKVDKTGDCWLWTGSTNHGYGQFYVKGKSSPARAHRVAYELTTGLIPEGMELDHLCHNRDASCPGGFTCPHRACVNPAHLEPVTHRVNGLRGRSVAAGHAAKTHCPQGHEYTLENTRRANGRRQCRACCRLWANARYAANKDAINARDRARYAARKQAS